MYKRQDILLGGNPEYKALEATRIILRELFEKTDKETFIVSDINLVRLKQTLRKNPKLFSFLEKDLNTLVTVFSVSNKRINILEEFISDLYKQLLEKYEKLQKQESELVKSLGGLYVIGTERHESRRIDNQLRCLLYTSPSPRD